MKLNFSGYSHEVLNGNPHRSLYKDVEQLLNNLKNMLIKYIYSKIQSIDNIDMDALGNLLILYFSLSISSSIK